jgi:hypothetical protein
MAHSFKEYADRASDYAKRAVREIKGEVKVAVAQNKNPSVRVDNDTAYYPDGTSGPIGDERFKNENLKLVAENKFYGHFLPSHFKKTRIIDTYGR